MIDDRVLGIKSHVRIGAFRGESYPHPHIIGRPLLPVDPCATEALPLAPSEFYKSFFALPPPTSFLLYPSARALRISVRIRPRLCFC